MPRTPEEDREKQRKYRAANPEKVKVAMKVDYAKNRLKRLAQKREYYERNKDRIRAYQKAHREANAEACAARGQRYREKNREKLLSNAMHVRSGFTLAYKKQVVAEQGNRCAICEVSFEGMKPKNVHADHCHANKLPRGVLCGSCNLGLGRFQDSPERLRAAADYIEKYRLIT